MESPYFNKLVLFVAQEERYNGEMTIAKEEFEQFAGPIYEDDRSYDARINSFHNWYILDRPLRSSGKTPLRYFLEFNANSLDEQELMRYRELGDNLHSLFELGRSQKEKTRVRDLVCRKKYEIEGTEQTRFMDRGTLFNTRIFRHDQAYYFSNYILLHPPAVEKIILEEAKRVLKAKHDPKEFLFQLVLFQSRYDQYEQMAPHNIYRFAE